MIDFELGIKENSGMDAAGLGDLCKYRCVLSEWN
jgi:hypothetical protein